MLSLVFGTNQKIPALVSRFLLTGDEPSSVVNEYANLKEPIPSAINALVSHGLEVHFVQLDYDQNLLSVVCREFDEFQTGKAFRALCLIPGLTPYQQIVKSSNGKKFTEIIFTNNEKFELGEEMISHALKAWENAAGNPYIHPLVAQQLMSSRESCLRVGPELNVCGHVSSELISFMKKDRSFNIFIKESFYYETPKFRPHSGMISYHQFLILGSRHTGQMFIVDPTYQQFVPGEDKDYLPRIMVIDCSSPESIIKGLDEHEVPERFQYFWTNEKLFTKVNELKKQLPNPESAFAG